MGRKSAEVDYSVDGLADVTTADPEDIEPLMGSKGGIVPRLPEGIEANGTIWSTVMNICNNILGAGLLTLPYGLKRASTIMGLLTMLWVALVSGYSVILLARCAEQSGFFSYKAIGVKAFGPRAGTVIESLTCLLTMLSTISFNILIQDFVTGVATHFVDGASGGTKQFLEIFDDRKYVILIIGGVVVLPLLFLKNLNALRFTSLMGVVSILFSGSVVCYFAFHNDSPKEYKESAKTFHLDIGVFVTASLLSVAFTMHYNALQFYAELSNRSEKRMATSVGLSFLFCFVLYGAVGLGGYYTFGEYVDGDVLLNYGAEYGIIVQVARLTLTVNIIFTIPLAFHAHRYALVKILWKGDYGGPWRFYPLTIGLYGLTVIVALFARDVSVVLAFKGAILASWIVFILPGMFYLRLCSPDKYWKRENVGPLLTIAYGLFYGIIGLAVTIMDQVNGGGAE